MKIRIFLFVAALVLCCADAASAASVETAATHAVMIDVNTGTVLLGKNADERMPTSSMSKVLTLYLVFDTLRQGQWRLTDGMPVSEKAWRMQGSKMFVKVGSNVKVEDLIRGVAVQSGNDATIVLAEGIAGSEETFVERMNERAKELGMANSHFTNASGWPDPEHYSTPRDLALLAQHLIREYPEYYHYFGEKGFVYNKIRQMNRDPLLGRVPGADGIKTGHTDVAGYGLIGSAAREGRRLILVINGLQSERARQAEGIRLMEWGFRNFENKAIVSKGEEIEQAEVWLGREEKVPLVVDEGLTVVLPVARRRDVKMVVDYKGPLQAPVRRGDVVGKLRVMIPGQDPVEMDLLAGKSVERKGIFGRVTSRLQYLLGG